MNYRINTIFSLKEEMFLYKLITIGIHLSTRKDNSILKVEYSATVQTSKNGLRSIETLIQTERID